MFKKIFSAIIAIGLLFIPFGTNVYGTTPSSNILYDGIDVSDWQGYIDYSKVKDSGVDIVYIKSSQGSNIQDPYFKTNYDNAKANGLKVGIYHFLTATTVSEARQEAEFFSSVISGLSPDCKLAMDFEVFGDLSKEEINNISLAFLERVESLTGKEMCIYCDVYNAENTFRSKVASKYSLWIAEYEVESPSSTGNWDSWVGFQFTDAGIISGINGYVDKDKFTEDIFLESIEEINTEENNETQIINYTVRRGDTLSAIARKYSTTVNAIAGLNGIQNPNLIYVGQILKIDVTQSDAQTEGIFHDTNHIIYTIKWGDTLTYIANRFGVSIENIVKLNNIKNPDLIFAGERLRI